MSCCQESSDLRWDIYHSGSSAKVRLTHLPTGTVVNVDARAETVRMAKEDALRTLKEVLKGEGLNP